MALYSNGKQLSEDEVKALGTASPSQPEMQQEAPGWFQPGSQSEAALRGFSNGSTLGLGKYVGGAVNGVLNGDSKKSTWQNIVDSVNQEKQANQNAMNTNPGSYAVGNVAGAAPVMVAGGAGALPAVMAKNAAIGAVQGAADDTSGNPLTAGAVGGAVGAGTSGVLGGAGKLLQAGANKVLANAGKNKVVQTIEEQMLQKPGLGQSGNPLRPVLPNPNGGNNQMVGNTVIGTIKKDGVAAGRDAANLLSPGDASVGPAEGPAWMKIKEAINGSNPSVMDSLVTGAKKGATDAVVPALVTGGAALATLHNPLAAVGGALAGGVAGATKATAGQVIKDVAGSAAAKDMIAGGTGEIAPNISNGVTQAVANKVTQLADGDGDKFGSIMNFLNQTDPEARAATNPDNPLNDGKQE